jgi:hypothetical protein
MSDSLWECASVGAEDAGAIGLWLVDPQIHDHGAAHGLPSSAPPTIKTLEPPVLGPAESCWSTPGAFGDPGLSRQQKARMAAVGGRRVSCHCR